MIRRIGSVPVAFLAIAMPMCWLSGAEMANLPAQFYAVQSSSPLDWLLPLTLCIMLVGFLLSRLAGALNPPVLRALLSLEQCRWMAILSTALVSVTWTGLLWSITAKIPVAQFFWQLMAGASIDVFVLVWLVLGTRAAASANPLQTARELAGWTLRVAGAGLVSLYVVADLLAYLQPEPNLLIIMVLVSLVTIGFLVPPAIALASAAALFSTFGGRRADAGSDTTPSESSDA